MKNEDRRQSKEESQDEFSVAVQELGHAIAQLNRVVSNVQKLSETLSQERKATPESKKSEARYTQKPKLLH